MCQTSTKLLFVMMVHYHFHLFCRNQNIKILISSRSCQNGFINYNWSTISYYLRITSYLAHWYQINTPCSGLNNFFKTWTVVHKKLCYVRQCEFQTGHQAKFFEKNQDIKSLWSSWKNLELLYLDKYQTQVSKCPSAYNRTSVFLKST